MFAIQWTERALAEYHKIEKSSRKGLFKQVQKTLSFLAHNPRHPGLKTHVFQSLEHPWSSTDKIFDAYAQNQTASAFRVFWCYGPGADEISIIAITPHP